MRLIDADALPVNARATGYFDSKTEKADKRATNAWDRRVIGNND